MATTVKHRVAVNVERIDSEVDENDKATETAKTSVVYATFEVWTLGNAARFIAEALSMAAAEDMGAEHHEIPGAGQ